MVYNECLFTGTAWLFISLLVILLIILCVIVFAVVYYVKNNNLRLQYTHELEMKKLEFSQKKEWDEMVADRLKKEEDEDWIKEKNEIKEHVDKLWKEKDEITPLDLKRVTMLHLILCGCKEGITPENMEKEMEKVKKTYEILKEYLKN